jgi:phosphate transport system substrate-binding protein
MRRVHRYAVAVTLALTLVACAAPRAATPAGAAAISCAAGSITAQGSSAQTNAVNMWIRNYQVSCPEATIAYASVGSGAGIKSFIAGTGDFAGSDSPLAPADQPKADARCKGGPAIHLPMVVGPIALAYNVAGVGNLQLRPATVAKIFAGTATTWDDPAIVADNPGAVLPSTKIVAVHRSDSSGTTDNVTKFLAATAAGSWAYGTGKIWPAPGGAAAKGSDGVSAAVAQTDGAIGYVEWSYAQFHNLNTARIGNGAHEFAALTAVAAGRTVANAKIAGAGGGGDLQLRIDYNTTAPGAYPLVLVTYEVVCRTGTPAGALNLVKSFLTYTSSATGQAAATRLGYAPLPDELRGKVASAVAGLH